MWVMSPRISCCKKRKQNYKRETWEGKIKAGQAGVFIFQTKTLFSDMCAINPSLFSSAYVKSQIYKINI